MIQLPVISCTWQLYGLNRCSRCGIQKGNKVKRKNKTKQNTHWPRALHCRDSLSACTFRLTLTDSFLSLSLFMSPVQHFLVSTLMFPPCYVHVIWRVYSWHCLGFVMQGGAFSFFILFSNQFGSGGDLYLHVNCFPVACDSGPRKLVAGSPWWERFFFSLSFLPCVSVFFCAKKKGDTVMLLPLYRCSGK